MKVNTVSKYARILVAAFCLTATLCLVRSRRTYSTPAIRVREENAGKGIRVGALDNTSNVTTDKQQLFASNVTTDKQQLFVYAIADRSGRQLLRSFMLDAFVAGHDDTLTVGGQCIRERWLKQPKVMEFFEQAQELSEFLGLSHRFVYDCPSQDLLESGKAILWKPDQVRPAQTYFTPEWQQSLLQTVKFTYDPIPTDKVRVAVHVRRGDVTPCESFGRYMPNAFFLQALDEYLPQYCGEGMEKECEVTIFSESETVESFEPFQERGYKMHLEGSLEEVYTQMINADVLVITESAFSYIPALLNRGTVIHPGFKHEGATRKELSQVKDIPPLPHWTVVDEDLRLLVTMENAKLEKEMCG